MPGMTGKTVVQRFLTPGTRLPLACGVAIATALLLVIPYRIAQGGYLTDVSGAWAALADDFVHGVLYRPVFSELGYGGTRYFPLHIVVHGGLAWLGLGLRPAGHLLSLASAVLLVVAGARALQQRGATRELAWSGVPLTFGAASTVTPAAICFALALLAKPTLAWAPAGAFVALVVKGELRAALKLTVLVSAITAAGLLLSQWASQD